MTREDWAHLEEQARTLGAAAAVPVAVSTIKIGAWTRMKCQYGCAHYGQTLCCPPHTPSLDFMREFLSEYEWALLVQVPIPVPEGTDWTAYNREVCQRLTRVVIGVEKEAFLRNYYRAFGLKAGRCWLCDTCNLTRCVHPDLARPAAEACGIDVMALARSAGFSARILTGPVKEYPMYGLILIE